VGRAHASRRLRSFGVAGSDAATALYRRCVTAEVCDSHRLPLQMMHEMPKEFFITTAVDNTN
jgi:hypothetical protein